VSNDEYLIFCRLCSGRVANTVKTCPHCGIETPEGDGMPNIVPPGEEVQPKTKKRFSYASYLLINCRTCKGGVAMTAKVCPHCGVDSPSEQNPESAGKLPKIKKKL